MEGGALEACLLVDDRPVPPIVHDDHVLTVVMVGLVCVVRKVDDEAAVESRRTLGAEMAMVEVGPRLRHRHKQTFLSVQVC